MGAANGTGQRESTWLWLAAIAEPRFSPYPPAIGGVAIRCLESEALVWRNSDADLLISEVGLSPVVDNTIG